MKTKIYFAGLNTRPMLNSLQGRSVLVSYFDALTRPGVFGEIMDDLEAGKMDGAVLDSGAFSELTRPDFHVDVEAFADYALEVGHLFDFVVNVDDIRGNVARSIANLRVLEARGVEAMPVFHQGEPLELLRDYAGSYGRLGIGFQRPITGAAVFLDQVFAELRDFPDVQVHGFGMTRFAMLDRAEWSFATADSATWIHEARGLAGTGKPHGSRPGSRIAAGLGALTRDDRIAWTLRSYDAAIAGESDLEDAQAWIGDVFGQARTVLSRLSSSDRGDLLGALRLAA